MFSVYLLSYELCSWASVLASTELLATYLKVRKDGLDMFVDEVSNGLVESRHY